MDGLIQNTQNLLVLRCCFSEDDKEIYFPAH